MKLSEHQLREIYQKRATRSRSSNCPSADELYQLFTGSMNLSERERIGSHLQDCSDCAEELRMARELSAGLTKIPQKAPVWYRPALRPLLAAAVVFLALSAGIVYYNRTVLIPGVNVERGEQQSEFRTNPADGAQLQRAPAKLEWSAIPGVQSYRVTLLDYESSIIVESAPLLSTEFPLSEEVRARLNRGQLYYWRIEFVKAGEQKSKLLRFSIR